MTDHQAQSITELNRELKLLIQYSAPADERDELIRVIEKYDSDIIALKVFHNFYSYLPEGIEDGIRELRLLNRRTGTFLFCAVSLVSDYLYLATSERAEFLGPLQEGIWEEEILTFFGWQDREDFLKICGDPAEFPVHRPLGSQSRLCPVCGVSDGEYHTQGCPVEICPWCNGQLTNCPCRFQQTGRNEIKNERQLEKFLETLTEKGRIPFKSSEHRPGFLTSIPD